MSDIQPTATAATFVVDLDTAVYRLAAVKKTAYKFAASCHVLIEPLAEGKVRVTLRAKRVLERPEHIAGEFLNEALDQELREAIAAETEGVRNLILAQAFSGTSLLDPQGETADYRDDPLGIAQSDEQKRQTTINGSDATAS